MVILVHCLQRWPSYYTTIGSMPPDFISFHLLGFSCEEQGVVSVILKWRDIIVEITLPPSMIISPTV